jgi:signal recognition particle GTPase
MPTQSTLHDFITQMNQVRALGPTATLLACLPIPGLRHMIKQIRMSQAEIDASIARMNAIYHAMTPAQQDAPDTLDATARREIAARAKVNITDVSNFLRWFEQDCSLRQAVGSQGVLSSRNNRPPARVLGLVTHDPLHRDPSFIHAPPEHWHRIASALAILIATAFLILITLR